MDIDQIRSKVRSAVFEGMVASGVNLSALSTDQRNKLVDSVSDQVLLTVNEVLDDAAGPAQQAAALEGTDEQVLWQGRPFLSLAESYVITSERIKLVRGVFGRATENFELIRVQDIDVKQAMGERMFGIGDITITGADRTNPQVVLRNIKDPQEVYELLRKAWLAARKRYGLLFREEM